MFLKGMCREHDCKRNIIMFFNTKHGIVGEFLRKFKKKKWKVTKQWNSTTNAFVLLVNC